MKGWLFTILRNLWLNQLRKRRNGPQIVEIEVEDGVANSIAEPSKNSHDLYVSKDGGRAGTSSDSGVTLGISRDYPAAGI
jgi:DNA-directed RNA polymerase specialized sigma24 family protein